MKILLVEPRATNSWAKNNQYVGLLRVGNWLQSTGHDVKYVVYPDIPGPIDFLPDQVYVTSMFTYDYRNVWEAVGACKQMYPGATVKLGGIYATLCPEHAKKSGADEVHVGRHPEAKDFPPDPSLLPHRPKFAYLFTSYGCDRACTYCATHLLFGKGIEQSNPVRVVDEIEFLVQKGFRSIWLGDDNILHNSQGHINLICEEILRRKIKVKMRVPGGMTAKDLTAETLALMRRAGFKQFSFAIESVDSEVRKRMGRASHTDEDDLWRAVEMVESSGLNRRDIDVYFLIGLPYQKLSGMVDTLVFLLGLGVYVHPQRLTPIPGTVDWKRMNLEGWDYEDLHYRTFVAPNQDLFTDDDLRTILRIARTFSVGSWMSGRQNWITEQDRVHNMFRSRLKGLL